MESNVLANPPLPDAVKLGIGNFANLFGTDKGLELQQTAEKFQWPLFWAYGEGMQTGLGSTAFPVYFEFDGLGWLRKLRKWCVYSCCGIFQLPCLGCLWNHTLPHSFSVSHVSDPTRRGPQPPQGPSQPSQKQKLNRRFADPSIVNVSNATMSSAGAQQFQSVWNEAKELRQLRPITEDDLLNWWESLSEQLHVAPVSATSCARPHHCVGVTLSGHDCICKICKEKEQKVENVETESFTV